MSTTDSQPVENLTPAEQEQIAEQQALREAMVLSQGVRRLGVMAGVKSLNRNLAIEDEANRRNILAHEREMFGAEAIADAPASGGDEMEIMSAAGVTITNNYGQQPATLAEKTAAVEKVVMAAKDSGLGDFIKKAAVITALASGGVTLPLATYFGLSGSDPPASESAVQPVIEKAESDLGLLPPEKEVDK